MRWTNLPIGAGTKLLRTFPRLKKPFWKMFYNRASRRPGSDFMNIGYAPTEPALAMYDSAIRYACQMYFHLANKVPISNKDVLEIGSGRGGGAALLQDLFRPKRLVCLDFSETNVALCNKHHATKGILSVQGDAEAIAFRDATFDVVFNVESSHCYPHPTRFYEEVFRVLRSGGHFVYADLFYANGLDQNRSQLHSAGFTVVAHESLTSNALEACGLQNLSATNRRDGPVASDPRRFGRESTNSFVQLQLRRGVRTYDSFVLRKP